MKLLMTSSKYIRLARVHLARRRHKNGPLAQTMCHGHVQHREVYAFFESRRALTKLTLLVIPVYTVFSLELCLGLKCSFKM